MSIGIHEKVNILWKEIQNNKFTIEDVILRNVPNHMSAEDVFEKVISNIVVTAKEEEIEAECDKCRNMPIFFCRCIGGEIENNTKRVVKVYCMIGISGISMDDTYLQCIISEYYKVISAWTSAVVNTVGLKAEFKISDILRSMGTDIAEFYDKIPQCFKKYMMEIYGIDVNIIVGLSGSYYEGSQCNSGIFFALSNKFLNGNSNGVQLKERIKVNEQNIRKMRKLLEMGNDGHTLVACKGKDNSWEIVGLYNKKDVYRGIVFRIIRHMVWYMEVEAKRTIDYKCGKYVMECEQFSENEFNREYKELFGKACGESLREVFRNAIKQEHGTIVVILGQDNICEEVKRLLGSSAGMEIESRNLDAEYIYGITSIDGAVLLDESGTCYAIGVILDGDVSVEGKAERGARFNSALKYVKTRKENGQKALAIVVSEDKTVNILSTAERG